jgi:hypothetical protein
MSVSATGSRTISGRTICIGRPRPKPEAGGRRLFDKIACSNCLRLSSGAELPCLQDRKNRNSLLRFNGLETISRYIDLQQRHTHKGDLAMTPQQIVEAARKLPARRRSAATVVWRSVHSLLQERFAERKGLKNFEAHHMTEAVRLVFMTALVDGKSMTDCANAAFEKIDALIPAAKRA